MADSGRAVDPGPIYAAGKAASKGRQYVLCSSTGSDSGGGTWGCPIPVVYCDACGIVPVPESELPVVLPDVEDYKPRGRPPLAQAEDWVNVDCPACGGPAQRETETMDTFVDSSWYFLRYCDPNNDEAPFDRALVDYWNPVDLYIGGVDHATMHMIYARFWVKVLNDLGLVGFREPFASFYSNGWVTSGKTKISKRSGTATGPDEAVERYGADAVRLCILFLGPADQDMEWTEESAEAMARFVRRLWRVVNEVAENPPPGRPRTARSRGRRMRRSQRRQTTSAGGSHSTRRSRR